MQRFKYQEDIDKALAEGCKMPQLHKPNGMLAYRYVFSYPHPNNHLPVLKSNPRRKLDASIRITGYGLSCFENADKAVSRYNTLRHTFKSISTTIGDSLSSGVISDSDGLVDDVEQFTSHFNLFEYELCDLGRTFKMLKKL